jgi:hypothetical protein
MSTLAPDEGGHNSLVCIWGEGPFPLPARHGACARLRPQRRPGHVAPLKGKTNDEVR